MRCARGSGASRLVPSENTAWICRAPSTTWLLVTITPSDEITKPVPAAPPLSGPPSSTIATTAGTSAFRICAMSPVREIRSDGRTITAVAVGAVVVELSSPTARYTPDATRAPTSAPTSAATRAVRRPSPWARSRRSGGTGGGGPTSDSTATGGAAIHAGPIGAVGGGTGAAGASAGGLAAAIGAAAGSVGVGDGSHGVVGASLRAVGGSVGGSVDVEVVPPGARDASPSAFTANGDQPDGCGAAGPATVSSGCGGWSGVSGTGSSAGGRRGANMGDGNVGLDRPVPGSEGFGDVTGRGLRSLSGYGNRTPVRTVEQGDRLSTRALGCTWTT